MSKILIYTVETDGSNCSFDNLDEAIKELKSLAEEGEPGDSYTLRVGEMTRKEYDNLNEFGGW